MSGVYRVIGVDSSPYTAKVRAVLRYRHLPHRWVCRFPQMIPETETLRPALMPVVQFPDGSYHSDSTPILYALEKAHPGERSILPEEAGDAFISHLLEDMADEWLARCLYYHRFSNEDASWFAARWVMSDAIGVDTERSLPDDVVSFRNRQLSRMEFVGAAPANGRLFETSYQRVIAALETGVGNGQFLFGTRPALADFGLYGQLRTLMIDPSGQRVMRREAAFTEHWVRRLDDTSGVDGTWTPGREHPALSGLLALAGDIYLPFLDANARGIAEGEDEFRVRLGTTDFVHPAFPYGRKCYTALCDEYAGLDPDSRARIEPLLRKSGCLALLEAAA